MKKLLWLLPVLFFAASAGAQSNAPVRLALIAEAGDISGASDILTAELSKNSQVTLLERNEIDRVYREQGLSAANQDYLKLGQVLGADGLLLIRASKVESGGMAFGSAFAPRPAQNAKAKFDVSTQLIAVKPGVLLASEQFSSVDDVLQWASGFATHLAPVLPKLSVLVQDAVPISIVNLRAAIQSPETQELERQLTSLTVQRLSHERQLFVLERRKMQLLASEKELKGLNTSEFWNGSYLLDGTIDRNGYSKDTMTLSAQLTPPKGGAPLTIEVSGSRTNLIGLINQLADKVRENLKLAGTAAPWNAADEAQKYFEEAKWALKWDLLDQAQSAAESAWALGMRDMNCAVIRVDGYARQIPEIDPVSIRHIDLKGRVTYISVTNTPDPAEITQALHLLNIYEEFARTLPPDELKVDAPYYITGLNTLHKATDVLRHFYFHPESQADVREKLADLRASARSVADGIGRSPSVRKTYWVDQHIPSRDEIYHDFSDDPYKTYKGGAKNIYDMELRVGRFWQERPEDCVALYRSLMPSPLFVCIHNNLWFPGEEYPPLTAWNPQDKKQVPAIWQNFIAELAGSTNYFFRMEAKIYGVAQAEISKGNAAADWEKMGVGGEAGGKLLDSIYAERDQKIEVAWNELFGFIDTNYDQIITGREQLLFTGLGVGELLPASGEVTATNEKLKLQYRNQDAPRLQALRDDYSSRFSEPLKEMQGLPTFKDQKEYLAKFTPFKYGDFQKLFLESRGNPPNYSKTQAAELKPLVEAYCSNLVAQATNNSAKFFANADAGRIQRSLGSKLDEILNAPAPQPVATASVAPPRAPIATAPKPTAPPPDEIPTNALVAKKFLSIPTNQLPATKLIAVVVSGHRMRDNKLLLDLVYRDDRRGLTNFQDASVISPEAAAIFSANGAWSVTPFPYHPDPVLDDFNFLGVGIGNPDGNGTKLYLEFFDNDLYVSDRDAIRRYDSRRKEWQELPFPGQDRAQLYTVNKHLYAASSDGIWEILDGGKSTRILASVRRRPVASALDSRDTLGQPALFSGKDNSLCVALNGDIFSWDGNDWKPVASIPKAFGPQVFQSTAFFRAGDMMPFTELWRFSPDETQPVLCLRQERKGGMYNRQPLSPAARARMPAPLWKSPANSAFARHPLTLDGTSIYILTVPVDPNAAWMSQPIADRDRPVRPSLVCLVPQIPEPLTIPIRLDPQAGPVTVPGGMTHGINLWVESSSQYVFIGSPYMSGVWALPKAEIRAELDRQIKLLPPPSTNEAKLTPETREKALLAKYDLNHNGQFDPEEKKAAINDPAFLEFNLEKIDANKNGQLDPEELIYFDANADGKLDPSEAAGLHAAQHILAQHALDEFDVDESGRLEQQEYWEFTRKKRPSDFGYRAMQSLPSNSEVERLEHYLEAATEDRVLQKLSGGAPSGIRFGQQSRDPNALKQEIQRYWAMPKAQL